MSKWENVHGIPGWWKETDSTVKHLIIDDVLIGEVKNYQQDRRKETWVFTMSNKVTVSVPFSEIKLFTSSEDYEIITRKGL